MWNNTGSIFWLSSLQQVRQALQYISQSVVVGGLEYLFIFCVLISSRIESSQSEDRAKMPLHLDLLYILAAKSFHERENSHIWQPKLLQKTKKAVWNLQCTTISDNTYDQFASILNIEQLISDRRDYQDFQPSLESLWAFQSHFKARSSAAFVMASLAVEGSIMLAAP